MLGNIRHHKTAELCWQDEISNQTLRFFLLSSAHNSKSLIGGFVARQNRPRKILFCLCLFICLSYVMLVVVNKRALGRFSSAYYRQYSINQLVVMYYGDGKNETIKILTNIMQSCRHTAGSPYVFLFVHCCSFFDRKTILGLNWI